MKQVQNNRTQRLILCVLLSLVVHAGLAATFVSAIRSKSVHLDIFNPIHVSLVQEVSDAVGTAASQSVESDLNQFIVSGTQPNSIDLIQLAEDSTDSANEVTYELVSAAVVSVDTNQPTDASEIDQPTPPPIVKKEAMEEIPDAEIQPVEIEFSDILPNTEQLPEPNELESIESAYVKAEGEPMPPKSVSVPDLHSTESVEHFTSQVTNARINNEIEHITESDQDLVSNITPFEFSQFEMHESAEVSVDSSDADKIAGIWSTDVMESATTKFDQPPAKEPTPEEIVESQIQVADIAELSQPALVTAIEVVQISPPEIIDDEHIMDEIASTPSLETESDIDEQFNNEPPSYIFQTAYSRIDDEIKYVTESEHQEDSDITLADGVNLPIQAGEEIAMDISDADEFGGILSSVVVEPAITKFNQPPAKGSSTEEIVESQIQVAGIAELSHPVSITAIQAVQYSPPEMIDDEHVMDKIVATPSLETETNFDEQFTDEPPSDIPQTVYSRIDDEIEHVREFEHQSDSDITSAEEVDSPMQAGSEKSGDILDADELAGIWPTEAIEPAVLDSDQLLSSEVTPEDIVESQIQVASATDLIEPVQHDANQVEPDYLPTPTFLVSGFNQTTSDFDKEAKNERTVGLNDSWLTDQVPSTTDQLAYAPPNLEPTPIREEIQATNKTPLEDEPLREADPPEITTTEQVIEPEVNVSETNRKETAENQPEFDNSSPLTIQESPDRTDSVETDEKSIPKERYQVASIDPVQSTVNSSAQGTTNVVTQKTGIGSISSDVGPKYGIDGLPNQAPRYPYLSRVNDEQGRVILHVVVDRKGRAKEVKVVESSGYSRLDKAARKAVKRWRFQPAHKDGQSIQGVVQVPINFVLNSS